MGDELLEIHSSALSGMGASPRLLADWVRLAADDFPGADLSEGTFRARLLAEDGGDTEAFTTLWGRALNIWDREAQPRWSTETAARTVERRTAAYNRLGIGNDLRKALDELVPVAVVPGPVVIARESTPWYTPERMAQRTFYWRAYEGKLRDKGWSEQSIADLDEASRMVVERITDPEQVAPYKTKGLVVGYVQSGKTANFTGVAAKAIDVGYRLVIVLGGTLNLLRAQTQRRLDMEMIGQENILRGTDPHDIDGLVEIDYVRDEDWSDFVQHSGRPSTLGAFDIERLTEHGKDYQRLDRGIRALEFEKREPTRPLYDPVNLHRAAARVMIVKKNKTVLEKLVKDLKQIHGILGELPALIIDDESDQASVNTSNPAKWLNDATDRSTINSLISKLLELLPRAQYVGYTATPFANVFVDPGDAQDIFPSDFVISLQAPEGYMGAWDFHDFGSSSDSLEDAAAGPKERAHVRSITNESGNRLQEALDSFLLAGALKLFRADHGVPDKAFRHHTMLAHESVKTDSHAELALHINSMWHQAGYSSTEGHARLASLLETDYRPVSATLAENLPFPATYDDLRPYVSSARQLIMKGGNPVIVVNGNSDKYFEQLNLDFDKTPNIWKILVGGTKLSRGFTIEGLTTTYFRRATRQADTLMQMGRWFGYRPGYRDLVRLFIGREEPLTKTTTMDLYKAYEGVCRDEEYFRDQLTQYAELIDGKPQVTPSQIPPLVSQHLPGVKPTARNKMFNAELIEIRSPGIPVEPLVYPRDPLMTERNIKRWSRILLAFTEQESQFSTAPPSRDSISSGSFSAFTTRVSHAELISVLKPLEWDPPGTFMPHLRYLEQLDGTLAKVDDWLVIVPRLREGNRIEASILGSSPLPLVRRSRQGNKEALGRVSVGDHRDIAQNLIDNASGTIAADLVGPSTGVLLLYPVVIGKTNDDVLAAISRGKADAKKVVMAFNLFAPRTAIDSSRRLLRFQARDSRRTDAAIVDAPGR